MTLTTSKHQEAWSYVQPSLEPHSEDLNHDRLINPDVDPAAEGRLLSSRPEMVITMRNLPFVRPSVCYVFGGEHPMSSTQLQEQKMSTRGTGVGGSGGVKARKIEKVMLPDTVHFAPLQSDDECAKASAEWLGR